LKRTGSISKKQFPIASLILLLTGFVIVKFFNDSFVRPVLGDYLVVLFQYCVLRTITNLKVKTAALVVLFFSYAIEFLQFLDILSILGIKKTAATDLIVGATFDWFDMLAYTFAYFTIIYVERRLISNQSYR